MRLLPLLFLTGMLPGCVAPGEGTPRGMSAAAGRAGAPCIPGRQARRPDVIAPAIPHAAEDGSEAACVGRDGRGVGVASAPKSAGAPSGHVVAAGPVVAGTGASGATSRPPSRVRGAVTPVIAPTADLVLSPVPDGHAPFITVVPNPFRVGTAAPEPVRGIPRPASRTAL